MSKKIIIISDFFKQDYISSNHPVGGAELNDDVLFSHLENLGLIKNRIHSNELADQEMINFIKTNIDCLFLISNFANMSPRVSTFLAMNCEYVIYEHDYKFHKYRNPINYRDFIVPRNEIVNFNFFKNAKKTICLSKLHFDIFKKNLGLENLHNTTCSLWSDEDLNFIESLATEEKRDVYAVVDSKNPIKRTPECVSFCEKNNLKFELISDPNYHSFLRKMASCKRLVALPGHPEPTPRVIVEAKMLGCEVYSNKTTVGVFYEDWFKLSGTELVMYLRNLKASILKTITEICLE